MGLDVQLCGKESRAVTSRCESLHLLLNEPRNRSHPQNASLNVLSFRVARTGDQSLHSQSHSRPKTCRHHTTIFAQIFTIHKYVAYYIKAVPIPSFLPPRKSRFLYQNNTHSTETPIFQSTHLFPSCEREQNRIRICCVSI